MYFDVHCHLHEFDEEEIKSFKDFIIVAVADDLETSNKTLMLAQKYGNILPCIGIHPWVVDETPMSHLRDFERLLANHEVAGIGEVGLDKRFVPNSYSRQLEFFKVFIKMAVDYDLPMNIHAPDAWRDVYELLVRYDVNKAVIHWYTGPLDLLEEIVGKGYYISINPALELQKKHMKVAVEVDLRAMLVESDGPYEYRGLKLTPRMIPKLMGLIADMRGIKIQELQSIVEMNFRRLFKK